MAESGIDLGFDYSTLNLDDFNLENAIDFDDLLGRPQTQEYYELQSKTMPVTERYLPIVIIIIHGFVGNENKSHQSADVMTSRDWLLLNKSFNYFFF